MMSSLNLRSPKKLERVFVRVFFLTSIAGSANEIRKDYLIDRWTIIATARKRRPSDFKKPERKAQSGVCALEPGNEHMTPAAVLLYLPTRKGIKKERDSDDLRPKNWLIRCVPNLYPAVFPPKSGQSFGLERGTLARASAVGHHEVLIESPNHDEHPGVARISQLIHVINAYIDRTRELSSKSYVKYVSIFRNHGSEAGASLSHAHTQLIATPMIPALVGKELRASRESYKKQESCAFCDIIEQEVQSQRFIWKNEDFVVFAPWASVHPFEFWIFPKRHQCCLLDMSQAEVESFAKTMRVSLGGLRALLDDPPYNFGIHQMTSGACDYYHWHLEVYPRLSIWAGFEKNTGMFINVVTPEDAATHMREATTEEEKKLSAAPIEHS